MTTATEVKRWTKGILAEHTDLVLEARTMYVEPTHHIYRAISFLGSSERTFSKPTVIFGALFAPPSVTMNYAMSQELIVGHSTAPNFGATLSCAVRDALDQHLRRLTSIQAFYDLTLDDHVMAKATDNPRLSAPELHAAVLAALGHLNEACRVAEEIIKKADEPRLLATLSENEALLAKRPRSSDARYRIKTATYWIERLQGTKRLRELAEAGDRVAIGALLRSWEQDRVRELGIEHLWEPTPFPVELPDS